jgi:peptidoglycan/xylan/chitin deacetylase (PgdA/CDA1 family)
VHAIFFVVGKNVDAYPQLTKRITAEGQTLGNHSYSHVQLSRLSLASVAQELDRTQAAVNKAAAITPNLFRPPYGDTTPAINNLAATRGLQTMMWSVDPRDWAQPGPAVITQRVVGGAAAGSNILLHVLHRQTADALPGIIEGLRGRGFIIN